MQESGRHLAQPFARVRVWFRDVTAPTAGDLPNRRVLLVFPALLVLIMIALVATGINGSSTGYMNSYFSLDEDPALLSGEPQSIRSDEWLVQSAWTISQVEQGLPVTNQSFPGGMDATVQHDLPSLDWSVAFRPHLWGFFLLPLDQAMAWKWWFPGFALMAACYVFVVSMLPRRPLTAAALSVGFFFAPFFQWWYLSITFWPAAWSFLVMSAVIWLVRSPRPVNRIVWPALVGYVTVTLGMGIYVPFIIAAVLMALAFGVGFVLTSLDLRSGIWERLKAVSPLLIGGIMAVCVLGIWILTRLDTVERFLGTVYPGERLQTVGQSTPQSLLALFGAPFTAGLGDTSGAPFSSNTSEASTFFLPGLFLVLGFGWLLARAWTNHRRIDWLLIALLALGGLLAAYLLIPGWDSLAHLLLLDRTTIGRIGLAFGLLSVVSIVVMANRLDTLAKEGRAFLPWFVTWAGVALAGLAAATLIIFLYRRQSPLLLAHWQWVLLIGLFLAAVLWFSRGRVFAGAVAFLIISLVGSGGVNPVYVGVYDLNDTKLMSEVKAVDGGDGGTWVGVGASFLPTVTLVQSGLRSYNGFQSAPTPEMWKQIDPTGTYEQYWNRLANVSWVAGVGAPSASNPAADQVRLTFDSCAAFAQKYVSFVLTDEHLTQDCLVLERSLKQGPTNFRIYEVVRP
ncbi:DUF7657 domain-containing protein [Cryobacterium ruanii]|uniref:Uncharacterized protein n=1 Tax=Cryobacterium ruanii TaxID=1259197 RepID=A0A4R9ASW8_9MICO|nr:hypothetical protein [Cryobacterium ruanii]TFD69370.1 hypothetical protein E3T47_00785 [Cryobacterium ruanii]